MKRWITASLSRKVVVAVAAVLAGASLIFLVLFVGLYRSQLESERSMASERINRLLQASLENAMVKRDLDGLRGIISRLGKQDGIAGVMILNPDREVRFSSDLSMLGKTLPDEELKQHTRFITDRNGIEVLRSVNPVPNKQICQQCHGPMAENPVNGVLFVDYNAAALRDKAMKTALTLGASGVAVLALILGLLTWILRRMVIFPLQRLSEASQALSAGDVSVRVGVSGRDEVAQLAETFNTMAQSLEQSWAEVRRQAAFQQALIDGIPDGVRVIDDTFRIVAANKAYAVQIGQPLDNVVGKACFRSSHQRSSRCPVTLVTCPLHELRDSDAPVKAVHQHHRANGEPFFVEIFAAPMLVSGDDGILHRMVVESIRDMSEDIEVSHGQRLSEVAQLATGIAHEIRNPMVSIRLALDGILRRGGVLDGDQVQEPAQLARYLSLVRDQMDTCIGVSERLLNLTHYPSEGAHSVDVGAALDDARVLLACEASVAGIDMVIIPPPPQTAVMATGPELRMVMINLMQNAFHAMPSGGMLTVTVESHEAHGETIGVAGSEESGADTVNGTGRPMVDIHFTDTGVGIDDEQMSSIFDPYYTKRADGLEGTGMGLTICRNIVQTYGGTITADSVVGQGTTFHVCLPLAEMPSEEA